MTDERNDGCDSGPEFGYPERCGLPVVWSVRKARGNGDIGFACYKHLASIVSFVSRGEKGRLDVWRLTEAEER